MFLTVAASAGANTYNVTPLSSDAPDINTADAGICDAGAGVCTLRAAVQTANSAGSAGFDTIQLPAGGSFTLTIPPDGTPDDAADGDLDITTNLEIKGLGTGATITGNLPTPVDRILHIPSGIPNVTLSNLTVTNGLAASNAGGGAIRQESGSLSIIGTSVANSQAPGNNSKGGGIFASATATSLSLTDSTVSGSHVSPNALAGEGGGIYTAVPTTLNRVTISGNNASQNCGNLCGGTAAGIFVGAGPSTFTNVTVSGNHSWGGTPSAFAFAGGISNASASVLTIRDSTVVNNIADVGFTTGGGNILMNGNGTTLENTIIAGGSGPPGTENCAVDAFGNYTSQGHNLESPTNQCNLTGPGDLPSVANPMLGSLTNNGGPTQTHALILGSPAIDAGGAGGLATDQRGVARPQGPACDIGAYELDKPGTIPGSTCAGPPAVITPATTPGAPASQAARKKCKRKKKARAARKKCNKRKKRN
ncbi:MAG: choice-of-anchor Q domain-containing protein [Solirubrobacterales bacterium]